MGLLSLLLIALGLSADCFAVALSASITNPHHSLSQVGRVSVSFGLFQAAMPLIGWVVGRTIVSYIAPFDHWVAFGLLVFVGGRMLWESFHREAHEKPVDVSRGLLLLTLSIATSIDALAVGLSFAFLEVNIWLAALVIGLTAAAVSAVGFVVGRRVGAVFGRRAELAGALILIGIGIRIVVTHLAGR
jgi:putative Mn2+ efflux pump MntP